MKSIVAASLSLLLLYSSQSLGETAANFLKEGPAPAFKEGHTLLPLTRWAWPLTFEANVELAQRWGYALEIEPGRTGEHLDNPTSLASRLVVFNKANANRYPVQVFTRRVMYEWDTIQGLLSPQAWVRNADGTLVLRTSQPVMKPYISNADVAVVAQAEVARLKRLRDLGVKATVILNGAEYMPLVPGHETELWKKDPEVSAWLKQTDTLSAVDKVDAFAAPKAKQEQAIRDAVLSVMPESEVVYYVTGDMRRGIIQEDYRLAWAYPYRHLIKGGTIPSWEFYYGYFGSWMTSPTSKNESLPVLVTNTAAQGIEDGRPLSYSWLSAGWHLTNPARVADDKRYMGFLKFLYTSGTIGNVAGYFAYPPGGFNGDLGDSPPDWLRQIMLLSHAHATFTHLESYLRKGDLLPGDGKHVFSTDLYLRPSWPHPSYEFVTNENSPSARVAARKLKDQQEWLIVAWAVEGVDREVSVTIPELGQVTLLARAEGSLYQAKPGLSLKLLDPVGMDPSRRVAEIIGPPDAQKPAAPSDIQVN